MINISNFITSYTDKNIILALSWGPDSIFLFHLITNSPLKDKLIACHLNHSFREDANNDEEFLKKLCENVWVRFESKKINIKQLIKDSPSTSFEEISRLKRYEYLREIKEMYEADYIILGHHLDDRIETFFLNLARWSKLSWLINMTEKSWDLLRPLLNVKKSEILEYLQDNKITYLLDSTNEDNDIKRNLLRNKALPYLEEINSSYRENIKNTMLYFEDLKNELDNRVKAFLKDWYFEVDSFNSQSELMKKEIIRYVYFIANWNSTIWLSENNIKEVIKFINWKNNKTNKDIRKMALFKDWNKIIFK